MSPETYNLTSQRSGPCNRVLHGTVHSGEMAGIGLPARPGTAWLTVHPGLMDVAPIMVAGCAARPCALSNRQPQHAKTTA